MRKKKIIEIGTVMVFTMLLTFISCNHQSEKYNQNKIKWEEQEKTYRGWEGNCTYFQDAKLTYYFKTEEFNLKYASEYVEKITDILDYAENVFDNDSQKLNLYIGFEKNELDEKSNRLLVSNDIYNYENIWEIVKKTHGNDIDAAEYYGLFYTYCLKNKIVQAETTKEDVQKKLIQFLEKEENSMFLDFTLPMLETVYFDEDEAEIIRFAVKQFAVWYADNYSLQEFENICKKIETTDSAILDQRKNEWLESIGCRTRYESFCKVPFRYNDQTDASSEATYKIEEEDAIWLWNDKDVRKLGYEDMVGNYILIEPLRKEDFAEAREYLRDYLPEDLAKVRIKTNYVNSNIYSMDEYLPGNQTIVIVLGWQNVAFSLLHEYCHFLTLDQNRILEDRSSLFAEWYPIGLANFVLQNREQDMIDYYVEEKTLKELGYWDYKNNCSSISLTNKRGTMLRYYKRLNNMKTEQQKDLSVSIGGVSSYAEKGTLAYYVIETYGFDSLVEIERQEYDFEKVIGITFQQLYFDMIDWLKPQLEDDEWLQQKLEEEGYNLQI